MLQPVPEGEEEKVKGLCIISDFEKYWQQERKCSSITGKGYEERIYINHLTYLRWSLKVLA